MELVEGRPLRTLLHREGKLAPARAVAMAIQVARALDYAHRRDVIHRDVKPANLLVTENEAYVPGAPAETGGGEPAELVKVVDFGIAKLMSKSLTQPGGCSAVPTTWRPSRCVAPRSTGVPISSRSAPCSTNV